jgi:hypothetical protein
VAPDISAEAAAFGLLRRSVALVVVFLHGGETITEGRNFERADGDL